MEVIYPSLSFHFSLEDRVLILRMDNRIRGTRVASYRWRCLEYGAIEPVFTAFEWGAF
jgi:hypothetical protein